MNVNIFELDGNTGVILSHMYMFGSCNMRYFLFCDLRNRLHGDNLLMYAEHFNCVYRIHFYEMSMFVVLIILYYI